MERGEIRWYQLARPDKKCPVLILTRHSALELLGEVTIAPITTTIREIPTEVVLTTAGGMPRECAINLDHVHTVSKGRLDTLLMTLNVDQMAEVREALLFALGFDQPQQRR